MKQKIITKEIKQQMKIEIEKVLKGESEIFEIDVCCPNIFIDIIEEITGELVDYEIDTNGCEYDYWIAFTIQSKSYKIEGSGFYGRTTFSIDAD